MILTEESIHDDKGADFIEIDSDQNQTCKKIHALAVAQLRCVKRIRCKHIVEDVLFRRYWLHELSDALLGECSHDIE